MKRAPVKKACGAPARAAALMAAVLVGLMGFTGASAEEPDKFRLSAGVFDVFLYDSTISLTDTKAGIGVSLNPERTLGWDGEQSVLRMDARYRFNDRHGLAISWYKIGTHAKRSLDEEIDWVDINGDEITIPINASVSSSLDYEIAKVAYMWSFHHSDKVELSLGAGLHLASIDIRLAASATSSGESASRAETFVPLPVAAFRLAYNVTPKLSWHLQSELFALRAGDLYGTYTDFQADLEYRWLENLAIGFGLGSNSLKVIDEGKRERLDFDNRITGLHLFLAGYF